MKFNYVVKALMSFVLMALMVFSNPGASLAASTQPGDKLSETKGFVRDTQEKVKDAAKSNAAKVSEADGGGFFAKKARRDAGRIQKRANEDAARTQKAIDKTKSAVNKVAGEVKDAID